MERNDILNLILSTFAIFFFLVLGLLTTYTHMPYLEEGIGGWTSIFCFVLSVAFGFFLGFLIEEMKKGKKPKGIEVFGNAIVIIFLMTIMVGNFWHNSTLVEVAKSAL